MGSATPQPVQPVVFSELRPEMLGLSQPKDSTSPAPGERSSIPSLESLNRKHPEWVAGHERWETLQALVCGGAALTKEIKKKLLVNPDGRPAKIIEERVKIASYVNKIAPILTRFNSQLFEEDGTREGSKDKFWGDVFFKSGGRIPGDDDNRISYFGFLRHAMLLALTQGKAIAQVDTRVSSTPLSRGAQQAAREDEPYAVLLPRTAMWDWAPGDEGFQFVKLHKFQVVRDSWSAPPEGVHDFTIYERMEDGRILASRYQVKKAPKPGQKPPATMAEFKLDGLKEEDVTIEVKLEPQEIFNLGGKFRFPILTLTLPETLHLADQLYDPQVSHFNVTTGIQWKLQSVNFAMPVVTGGTDEDDNPLKNVKVGDGYYLWMPEGFSVSSFEIGGSGIATAQGYRQEIAQDIKDILYQVAIAAADAGAVLARSGQSKKEDRRPEQILLETYGSLIKEFDKQILDVAAIAHGEDVDWSIEGFDDFLGEGLVEDIADFAGIKTVPVPSITFARESTKAFARRYAQAYDMEDDTLNQVIQEIDQAPEEKFFPPAPPEPGQEVPGGPGEPVQ